MCHLLQEDFLEPMDHKGQFLFSVQHFGQLEGCEPEAPVTSDRDRQKALEELVLLPPSLSTDAITWLTTSHEKLTALMRQHRPSWEE